MFLHIFCLAVVDFVITISSSPIIRPVFYRTFHGSRSIFKSNESSQPRIPSQPPKELSLPLWTVGGRNTWQTATWSLRMSTEPYAAEWEIRKRPRTTAPNDGRLALSAGKDDSEYEICN
jgi:hypothetical protein